VARGAVADKLARLLARRCKSQTVHNIIEPSLKQNEQICAGFAGVALCFLENALELALKHAIHIARLLLFKQLQPII
jgi:hypothetical protein